MIEQAMIFALGFLIAGLAALAFAPAFWARANRLTRRQLEMQIPLSVQEILAERDQLRAEFAVERCRLDQRAQHLADRHAEDLAQIGRLLSQTSAAQGALDVSRRAATDSETAAAHSQAELRGVQAELAALHKAFYDAEGLLERKHREFLEYVRLQDETKLLAEMRFAALAASDARVASLELRLGDLSRNLMEAEQNLTQKELHARSLADAIAGVRRERESAEAKATRLQERLDAEVRRTQQLGEELAGTRRKYDDDLNQFRSLLVKANVSEATLDDLRRREKDMLAQRDLLAERTREAERTAAEKYDHLRSEYAAAQGALDVARQRSSELESKLARYVAQAEQLRADQQRSEAQKIAPALSSFEDNAHLRESIREIGDALIRVMRPNGEAVATSQPLRLPPATVPQLLKPDPKAEAKPDSEAQSIPREAATP